ncbi:Trk family potassium uptake protein [candidate division WOR-3 bacterium]|nr:Trk family potassium uptake protein [candidate division WOR-3 bacterium]
MNRWSPFRSIILVYVSIIIIGTLLLLIPQSSYGISFIDALFASASATCVTGLIVKDTATNFTFLGKGVILFLIQIGGMGYMAFASLFMILFRIKPDVKQGMVVKEEFGLFSREKISQFLRLVVLTTLGFEFLGIILLYFGFRQAGYLVNDAISHSVFHAVSAFCNAGFSSFSTNLANFYKIPLVALTVPFLFITGGLGFVVLREIFERVNGIRNRLSLHSRIVLLSTFTLIVTGSVMVFILELGNKLSNFPLMDKIIISFFTAVTPRTAGFSLIDISGLLPTTLIFLMIFMFIGASPGGTGGGIKTTTFVILNFFMASKIKGRKSVNIEKRRISEEQVNKALTLFLISLILIISMVGILSFTEREIIKERGLLPVIFEEFSAFGTVGLSMGSSKVPILSLSHDFSVIGKLIIILTMMAGRVGPLTIAAMVMHGRFIESVKYPLARVQIG